MPDKKLSKKVLKTSKKTGKIKGLKDLNKRMIKDSKFTKGFAPTEKPAPKSPVKSMVTAGMKNSGMRKTAKKKREALREARKEGREKRKVQRMDKKMPKKMERANRDIKSVREQKKKTKQSQMNKMLAAPPTKTKYSR